ncbi:hypothetical protein ACOME3_006562 [Neoechinorhynchus agilis]
MDDSAIFSLSSTIGSTEEESQMEEESWMSATIGTGRFDDLGNYIVDEPKSTEVQISQEDDVNVPIKPMYSCSEFNSCYEPIPAYQIDLNLLDVRSVSAEFIVIGDSDLQDLDTALLDPYQNAFVQHLPNANIRNVMWFVLSTQFSMECKHIVLHVGTSDFHQDCMPVPEFAAKIEHLVHVTHQKARAARIYYTIPIPAEDAFETNVLRSKLLDKALYKMAKRIGSLFFTFVRWIDWKQVDVLSGEPPILTYKPMEQCPIYIELGQLKSKLYNSLKVLLKAVLDDDDGGSVRETRINATSFKPNDCGQWKRSEQQ